MNYKAHDTTPDSRLEAKALLAVRQARELAEELMRLPRALFGELSRASVSATRRRLEIGEISDGRDLVVLEAVQARLVECIASETAGHRIEPRHAGYDAEGDCWAWVSVPHYTDRGEAALALHTKLVGFLNLRQELLDRGAAERLVMRSLR